MFQDYIRENTDLLEKLITFGGKAYPKFGQVVILAGGAGCYPKGTEFFNGTQWKPIEEFKQGEKVLQYDKDTGKANLAEPLSFVDLPIDQFYRIKNRRVDFTTSSDHKHLLINEKTGSFVTKKTKELLEKHDSLIRGNKMKLVKSFDYSGSGIEYTEEQIRLHVAIIADGHSLKQENKFRMSFKKERKIERFERLLKLNNIEYKKYKENGFTRFEFYFFSNEKDFEPCWYNCNKEQLKVVADEVLFWDGCIHERDESRKPSSSFSTTSKKTKDFVQFMFSSLDKTCTVYEDTHRDTLCYDLRISHSSGCGISKNDRSKTGNTTTFEKVKSEDSRMYCFETETGFFVVRQNNQIFVSGNSGKGFQIKNLLGIEGKKFDVDALKELAIKSDKFARRVKDETGNDLSKFNLKNPENVSKVHEILASVYNLPDKNQQSTFTSILAADSDRKPNLIFDVTLKGMRKLETISRNVRELGYDAKNIHIVWVVNDVNVAMKQNQTRDRVVPDEILLDTHEGVALTMKRLLSMGDKITKYMDGDIWLTFNKFVLNNKDESDTGMAKSNFGGSYIEEADYIRVKKQGGKQQSPKELDRRIYDKIKKYVPDTKTW